MSALKIDRELADAIRHAVPRWRAWCNECGTVNRPTANESDADEWLTAHVGHDAGKVASL